MSYATRLDKTSWRPEASFLVHRVAADRDLSSIYWSGITNIKFRVIGFASRKTGRGGSPYTMLSSTYTLTRHPI